MKPLVMMEFLLVVLVFIGLPLYSWCMRKVIQQSVKAMCMNKAQYDKLQDEKEKAHWREIPDKVTGNPTYKLDPTVSAGAGLRAFNLPRGSIRGMLALLAVGSFVIVLTLGGGIASKTTTTIDGGTTTTTIKTTRPIDNFDQVVTAFGTLTGAIIGFYFGGRSSSSGPEGRQP